MIEYSYQVQKCQSGQWRYAVIEHGPDGDFEIEGGAGFDTEKEADFAGFDAVATWRGRLESPDF